jgi:hypothetical protein
VDETPDSSVSVQDERFKQRCRIAWNDTWQAVERAYEDNTLQDSLSDPELLKAIHASINGDDKSYPFVLPTQLISKFVNPTLNAKCLQAQLGGPGAFDARTIAHYVLVEFDQSHSRVLGGATSPYLNNPLRTPQITLDEAVLKKKKNRQGWINLFTVLDAVQRRDDPVFTTAVLRQVQKEIIFRLNRTKIIYPTPHRISLNQAIETLEKFLSTPSRGDKAQAVATALFEAIRKRFGIYSEVRRSRTNAADAETGQLADIRPLA